ncbi:MarR family transcriptional regulator [Streptomyces phaeochromogenes]|uniref:MarR family transcriptional regulator n=1 Tax=Streptomyces phaeochromogenes TaxID=1923 RepID=UPI003678395B
MSDTTTDATRTLHAVPTPEPVTGLTGAAAAIHAELTARTEPVTAAELALAAGVGRSTAGKALITLEELGLAVRIPGGHDGPRRTPDHWRAPATQATSNGDGDGPRGQEPISAQPQPPIADSLEPVGNSIDREGAPATETTPDSPAAWDGGSAKAVTAPVTEAPQDTEHDEGDDEDGSRAESGSDDSQDEDTTAPQTNTVRPERPAEAISLAGERKRLAPGALRQMIIDHLEAHPGEAFTATKISRVIEKSSGAIANALVTLARQGIAEQVSNKPLTYRLTAPKGD